MHTVSGNALALLPDIFILSGGIGQLVFRLTLASFGCKSSSVRNKCIQKYVEALKLPFGLVR